jgi:arylsulfatase A-like enzyme
VLFGVVVAVAIAGIEASRSGALVELRLLGHRQLLSSLAMALAWHAAFGAALGLGAAAVARLPGPEPWRARLAWALPLAGVLAVVLEGLWQPLLVLAPRAHKVAALLAVVVASALASLGVVEGLRRVGARVPGAPRSLRLSALLLLGAGGLALSLLFLFGAAVRAPSSRPNVVLFSMDTVRADHLGPYGYPRPTSPTVSRLAEQGVVFESAWAPEPWTLPSHMTMMTSLLPLTHGVRSVSARLAPERITLAERLHEVGYQNVAFVATGPKSWVGGQRGFADGFDLYHHPPHSKLITLDTSLLRLWNRFADTRIVQTLDTTRTAVRYVEAWADEPFFLFVHNYYAHSDVHRLPYEAPSELLEEVAGPRSTEFSGCDEQGRCAGDFLKAFGPCAGQRQDLDPAVLQDLIDHYDAGIRVADNALGRVVAALERRGVLDRTLVIVTSDHGEEFLEHGRFLHTQLRPELLRVPFVVRLPGAEHAGMRIEHAVSHLDLMPTVLDLLGLEPGRDLEGRSLVPLLRGEPWPPRPLFFSSTEQSGEFRVLEVAMLEGHHQLVRRVKERCEGERRTPDLLSLDVREPRHTRAIEPHDPAYTTLKQLLDGWLAKGEMPAASKAAPGVVLDDEERELLEALGYLGE